MQGISASGFEKIRSWYLPQRLCNAWLHCHLCHPSKCESRQGLQRAGTEASLLNGKHPLTAKSLSVNSDIDPKAAGQLQCCRQGTFYALVCTGSWKCSHPCAVLCFWHSLRKFLNLRVWLNGRFKKMFKKNFVIIHQTFRTLPHLSWIAGAADVENASQKTPGRCCENPVTLTTAVWLKGPFRPQPQQPQELSLEPSGLVPWCQPPGSIQACQTGFCAHVHFRYVIAYTSCVTTCYWTGMHDTLYKCRGRSSCIQTHINVSQHTHRNIQHTSQELSTPSVSSVLT